MTATQGFRARPLFGVAMAAVGMWPWFRLFDDGRAMVLLGASLCIGGALGIAIPRTWPFVASFAVGILGSFVVVLVIAAGFGIGPATAIEQLRNGWELMRVTIGPFPGQFSTLAVPVFIGLLSSLLAVVLSRRSRGITAVVPPVFAWVCGALQTPLGQHQAAAGVAVVAVAISLLLAATGDTPAGSAARRSLISAPGLGMTAVVLAAAIAAAVAVPTMRPDGTSVRLATASTNRTIRPANPLALNPAALSSGKPTVRVTSDAPLEEPVYLRAAIADRFDGSGWTTSIAFRPVGSSPTDAPATSDTRVVIELELPPGYRDQLPVAAAPVRSTADGDVSLHYSAEAGVLGAFAPQGGVVTVEVALVDTGAEVLVDRFIDQQPASLAAVGTVASPPEYLATLAAEITANSHTAFDQIGRLMAYFRANVDEPGRIGPPFAVDDTLPVDPSFSGIERTLASGGEATAANPLQIVAAFAALARIEGFPTRIVSGYVLDVQPGTATTADLNETPLSVWAEVAFGDVGWVRFDPVPSDADGDDLPVATAEIEELIASRIAEQDAAPQAVEATEPVPLSDPDPEDGVSWAAGLVVVGLLMAVAVASWWMAPIVRKRRRRGLRLRQLDAQGVSAAWAELVDGIVDAEVVPSPLLRTTVVLERLSVALPEAADEIDELGNLVARSVFAPAAVNDNHVARAWELSDRVRDTLMSSLERPQRRRARRSTRSFSSFDAFPYERLDDELSLDVTEDTEDGDPWWVVPSASGGNPFPSAVDRD